MEVYMYKDGYNYPQQLFPLVFEDIASEDMIKHFPATIFFYAELVSL